MKQENIQDTLPVRVNEAIGNVIAWTGITPSIIEGVEIKLRVQSALDRLAIVKQNHPGGLQNNGDYLFSPSGEAALTFLQQNYGGFYSNERLTKYQREKLEDEERLGYDHHKEFWRRLQENQHSF